MKQENDHAGALNSYMVVLLLSRLKKVGFKLACLGKSLAQPFKGQGAYCLIALLESQDKKCYTNKNMPPLWFLTEQHRLPSNSRAEIFPFKAFRCASNSGASGF